MAGMVPNMGSQWPVPPPMAAEEPPAGFSAIPMGGDHVSSSFLREARSQAMGGPGAPQPSGGWQAQLSQHLDRVRAQPQPQPPSAAAPPLPQRPGDEPAAPDVGGMDSSALTEDEFQSYGQHISMSGVTIGGLLRDGDEMPRLEPLSNSVCLRITPTGIIFLHQYDRNFILEIPLSELYEITEDSDNKAVLLHTRNAVGSALIQLSCPSQRKRLGIYKTLCIRKNALERLKRQQQQIVRTHYTAPTGEPV
eukprot:TRINITY_DN799_c1_g1_i2.p1 TRINITY_DN799_c1_g1~~TRINITY_DN799_c1_g1_i2.p1  ORF type:complete len:270 (+),score=61.19 TRINITY_DN799_c1_g1_i2:62-811(+)